MEPMSREDQNAIAGVLSGVAEHVRAEGGLGYLYRRWQEVAHKVQAGYDLTIDDYTNDLSTRDILARVLRAVSPSAGRAIEAAIEEADSVFRSATVPSERTVYGKPLDLDGWWWHRIPKRAGEELGEDLRKLGLEGG